MFRGFFLLDWDCEEKQIRASSAEDVGPSVWEQSVSSFFQCCWGADRGRLPGTRPAAPLLPLLHRTENEMEKLVGEGREITYQLASWAKQEN